MASSGRVLIQAIGDLLPAAIGVALSPIPIIAVVLMLGTPKARTTGAAFALGWIAGLVAVSVIVLLITQDADNAGSDAATGVNWVKTALGALFLVMAVRQWRGRPKDGDSPEMPKWMAKIDSMPPTMALGLGALLSGANPKNLALTVAAAASISEAGLPRSSTGIAVAVYVAISSITVVGPVLYFLIDARRASSFLSTVKQFLSAHNAVIMMIVLLILGAKLLGDGLGDVMR